MGGIVGFFLGLSFLSIAQIPYYFILRCFINRFRFNKLQKYMVKNKDVDEAFAFAKMKLIIAQGEKEIRRDLNKKKNKYY